MGVHWVLARLLTPFFYLPLLCADEGIRLLHTSKDPIVLDKATSDPGILRRLIPSDRYTCHRTIFDQLLLATALLYTSHAARSQKMSGSRRLLLTHTHSYPPTTRQFTGESRVEGVLLANMVASSLHMTTSCDVL